jgi:N-6 DNA Methylase
VCFVQLEKLAKCALLYQVTEKFAAIDLHPDVVSNNEIVFEELIRKFAELSNETAGEHFTPREVIRLKFFGNEEKGYRCVYRKPKPERNDDEARQGSGVM